MNNAFWSRFSARINPRVSVFYILKNDESFIDDLKVESAHDFAQ
jgi:hypothetical protein